MNKKLIFFCFLIYLLLGNAVAQSHFFKQYWVEYDGMVNNNKLHGERTRVNDRETSTDRRWYQRYESQINGLALVQITDTISNFDHAELFCEMWGGHPKTTKKRFQINGGRVYDLPSKEVEAGNCEYRFPVVPIDYRDLVKGTNALQFACDKGESFWGHFFMAEIAINGYFKANAPELKQAGLANFVARPLISDNVLADRTAISLDFPEKYSGMIASVSYFGGYIGFDESGTGSDVQWHGYQFKRKFTGHLGTSTEPPYKIIWNTRMVPDQEKPMALKAMVQFKNGFFCWTEALDGLVFPNDRPSVQLFRCPNLPVPFWSRDNQLRKANLELPDDLAQIENAELHVRTWDGGEGTVKEPFKLNGISYRITSGNALHDLIYTINPVLPVSLKTGNNEFELLSDTQHHGIEICLPGPCLIIRYKK